MAANLDFPALRKPECNKRKGIGISRKAFNKNIGVRTNGAQTISGQRIAEKSIENGVTPHETSQPVEAAKKVSGSFGGSVYH